MAALLLLGLAPLLLAIAALVRAGGGPVWYTQQRLGRGGAPFALRKFRTLVVEPDGQPPPPVTPTDDPRVTRIGRCLRRWHLDELPQLLAVLAGRMALVGPRPEVPDNLVEVAAADRARLLAVRPGLTGPTQLAFVGEDDVLAEVDDPVAAYRRVLVPAKVRADLAWLARRTWRRDLAVMLRTPLVLVSGRARERSRRHVRALLGLQTSRVRS